MTKFAALRQAIEDEGSCPMDYWGNKQPRCPHCGTEHDVSDNDWYRLYDEGEHEVTCPSCDEEFTVSTRVSFSFSTYEQEGMDEAAETDSAA